MTVSEEEFIELVGEDPIEILEKQEKTLHEKIKKLILEKEIKEGLTRQCIADDCKKTYRHHQEDKHAPGHCSDCRRKIWKKITQKTIDEILTGAVIEKMEMDTTYRGPYTGEGEDGYPDVIIVRGNNNRRYKIYVEGYNDEKELIIERLPEEN